MSPLDSSWPGCSHRVYQEGPEERPAQKGVLTSSMQSMVQLLRLQTPLLARSRTRPGVATSKCTGWYRRMMSSLRLVPPVVAMIWIWRCFASSLHTCDVCRASSRVGTRISTATHTHTQEGAKGQMLVSHL